MVKLKDISAHTGSQKIEEHYSGGFDLIVL